MNTKEIAAQYRMEQWTRALQEKIKNGETIDEFCLRSGVSRNTYFYWQRKLRETICQQLAESQSESTELSLPSFTEIKIAEPPMPQDINQPSQICVEIGKCKITADGNYPAKTLVTLIREMRKLC